MNASEILRATVDADGRLLSADGPIARLQAQAGGVVGGLLAVPQLAALARLAGRMNIPLSRPVIAAGPVSDIDMWVRAQPRGPKVELSVVEWRERPPRVSLEDKAARDADLIAAGQGWLWQIDPQLRLVIADAEQSAVSDLPKPGSRLTAWFAMAADAEGDMPILRAFAERRSFAGQQARGADGREYALSGLPMFEVNGRLSGYRGKALPLIVEAPSEPNRGEALPLFGRRLDRALRQPLGRIIANADTISNQLEGPLRQDYAAYAADIATAGRHLMELVDDLADLQAIDRPDFEVSVEDVDVADLARRASGLLAVKAADRSIHLEAPGGEALLEAQGEFRRALQVLVNLIGNAIRYSPEGSVVRIGVEQVDRVARVTVTDQGQGIAEEDRERIFDKFERLGRDEAGGSGLGLYISRRLARAMGGDVIVESEPGKGAKFVLSLPLK
ncbi:MAG: HAMP domain-containing sensor histidine kinase [Sphingobium sp.]|uniref:sensor histidine kinase n=1 Tax=Sphingobium sp. TaxID=1912891 RepID=UPI0029AAB83F|nr:HAMP domain-containing sensor histidine kinase [Sphingobium sp.]MDX3908989.1 HAMP domain-containing sensor histidine kinase [Sphingobium sp.]